MLARFECATKEVFADPAADAAFPAIALQIKEIVNEDRLVFFQEEAVNAQTGGKGDAHSFGASSGNCNLGGNGVVLVQNARSIADGNVGVRTRVSETRLP